MRFSATGLLIFISARLRIAACALLAAWAIKLVLAASPLSSPHAPEPVPMAPARAAI